MNPQNIVKGQYIQIKTKTNRHQLHNVWLQVKTTPKPDSSTVTCMYNGTQWRISRSLVKTVSDNPVAGGKLTEVPAPAAFTAAPKTSGASHDPSVAAHLIALAEAVLKLQREIAELKALVGHLANNQSVSTPKPFSAN